MLKTNFIIQSTKNLSLLVIVKSMEIDHSTSNYDDKIVKR